MNIGKKKAPSKMKVLFFVSCERQAANRHWRTRFGIYSKGNADADADAETSSA